ncbi:molecular chaperone [Providencia rettgeri]|uniref:fimbrial biogenesis chaperone n=1 Tax=Providencia rettgeri TaxID=587 RepID=UPI0034E0A864
MCRLIVYFLLVIFPALELYAQAEVKNDILFSLQRHTYIEGDKSISIGMRNTENSAYLVQTMMTWLDESSGVKQLTKEDAIPFIVTPPLNRFEPGQYYDWRIIFSGNSTLLAKDRESVFLAKFVLIPASNKAVKNTSDMAVLRALTFKIYYRPKTLKSLKIENVQDKISFRHDGNKLIVKNDSPLYLMLDKVSVGNIAIDSNELFKPLIPFSEQTIMLPENIGVVNEVEWNLLDEFAFSLEKRISKLN